MDQCFWLGLFLGWSIFLGLLWRARSAALAGGVLFFNWWLWSFVIMGTGDWEPWAIAVMIDAATGYILWRFCRLPGLAISSFALVGWHIMRAANWIDYEVYYHLGWMAGVAQAGLVVSAAWDGRKPVRWMA